jgi:tetratricopeptide (TPR) repeat protein
MPTPMFRFRFNWKRYPNGLGLVSSCLLALSLFTFPMTSMISTASAADERADESSRELDEDFEDALETIDLEALNKDRDKKAKRYPTSTRVKRYLEAASIAVDQGEPEEAEALLDNLFVGRLNPVERARVMRMRAFIAHTSGDSKLAIDYFKSFLDLEALSINEEAVARFQIAQLYASIRAWRQMIDAMNDWLRYVEDPNPLGYYLMAIGFFQLDDYDKAIEAIQLAIGDGHDPKESWLRLLASLHSEKQDYARAIPVFEELILRYPKKQYWVQLSLIYGARTDFRRALTVQQAAYAQDLLTSDKELKRLARSYLYHDLPYPAANVLEQALEGGQLTATAGAYELLANSWIQAREYKRSRGPLNKAAELSTSGDLYVRLGQVYMQDEDWGQASTFFEEAVKKGELKDPGNAELLLGISYYNGDQPTQARAAFKRARTHEKTKAEANRWITHLDTESADNEESAG